MKGKIIETLDEREKYIHQKKGRGKTMPLTCNNESLAGAVSQRACVYSGARVVLNPITDALHLVHGPIDVQVTHGTYEEVAQADQHSTKAASQPT